MSTHTEPFVVVPVQPTVRAGVRYLLCPGIVMSRNDGKYHYVSASDLAHLYGIQISQCKVRPGQMIARFGWRPQSGVIELHPRYDGDYSLPHGA